MSSAAHRRWTIESTLGLPILWSFVALLLAMAIPPPPLSHQLKPLYHHTPHRTLGGDASSGEGRSALILTAHPDDEAMFFSPTIRGLQNDGWEVRGLCLSVGDAEGLGEVRREELVRSYEVLGVEEKNVQVLDVPYVDHFNGSNSAKLMGRTLRDHMEASWNIQDIQKAVDGYLSDHSVDVIITFDAQGVSSHPNHASLASYRPPPPSPSSHTKLYHLITPSLLMKYTGPLNPVFRRGYYQLAKGLAEWADVFEMKMSIQPDFSLTNAGLDWIRSVRAMMQHKSQLVWYRYGWLAAGSMMWVNDLELVLS